MPVDPGAKAQHLIFKEYCFLIINLRGGGDGIPVVPVENWR